MLAQAWAEAARSLDQVRGGREMPGAAERAVRGGTCQFVWTCAGMDGSFLKGLLEGEMGKGETNALVVDLEGVDLVLGEVGGALEGVLDRHAGWRGVVGRYLYI